jgi:hypothetical protein
LKVIVTNDIKQNIIITSSWKDVKMAFFEKYLTQILTQLSSESMLKYVKTIIKKGPIFYTSKKSRLKVILNNIIRAWCFSLNS